MRPGPLDDPGLGLPHAHSPHGPEQWMAVRHMSTEVWVPVAPKGSGWLDLLAPPAFLGRRRGVPGRLPSSPAHTLALLKQRCMCNIDGVPIQSIPLHSTQSLCALGMITHFKEDPCTAAVNGVLQGPAKSPEWGLSVSFCFQVRVRIFLQTNEVPDSAPPAMHIMTSI